MPTLPKARKPVPKGPIPLHEDGRKLVSCGLSALMRIASRTDSKQAIGAALALVEIGERILMQQSARDPKPVERFQQTRAELIQELKGLYAKALPPAPPLVVDQTPADTPENRF